MRHILIVCPETKMPVSTGIRAATEEAYETLSATDNVAPCSSCGRSHAWSKADSFLGPEVPD